MNKSFIAASMSLLTVACVSVDNNKHSEAFKIKPTSNNELIHAANAAEYEQLGERYASNNNSEMAITAYKKALAKDPKSVSVLQKLSTLLMQHNRTEEALVSLEQLVQQSPTAKNYNNLGFAYYQTGDYVKANHYYSQALSLDHQYIKAKNNLALLQMSVTAAQPSALTDSQTSTLVAAAPVNDEAGASLAQKNKYVYSLAYNDSKEDSGNVVATNTPAVDTSASTPSTAKPASNVMGIIIAVLTVILLI